MAISSIFNDVIGPVMRGPSSSHSAAACRIGLILHELMKGDITHMAVDYDPNGSLVTTHESQGTDMGLYGGLLGWQADDPRMMDYKKHIKDAGIKITINYLSYDAQHPNNYRIRIGNDKIAHTLSAISTGGGMMEVQEIDASKVSINGDYHELLIYGSELALIDKLLPEIACDYKIIHKSFIEIKSADAFDSSTIERIEGTPGVTDVCYLHPVLPILSRKDLKVPFMTCKEMLELGQSEQLELWQLATLYESMRGDISEEEVFSKMKTIVEIMRAGITEGLKGTYYEDRILPVQSLGYKSKMDRNQLLDGGMLNNIVLNTTAMMEVKSSMGVFVAAPTAGSCGALPGAIFGAAENIGSTDEEIARALLASGIMGVFISEHSTFAAEVAGCQAETGAGGSMAAAGLVTLMNGSLEQCVAAASLALQNSLGIVCDPIGNRVEAPCLGKNVMAASNAMSCANMALANYEHLIPYDEVVQSMKEVGDMMAHELTCTGLGGLAATPTGKAIEAKLKEKAKYC
ncbi:MAG: L-serine ammonia-lyase, iron-sulfur-dependent, subunit alpha [Reichenbachiella sp.]|uniref:L-serine ammonia-lyase, iron-sulfur-dependent, subunit alpha n=1 Tax=Reichenbachiella sp. TaxID=2184521 RepID=UPI003265A589